MLVRAALTLKKPTKAIFAGCDKSKPASGQRGDNAPFRAVAGRWKSGALLSADRICRKHRSRCSFKSAEDAARFRETIIHSEWTIQEGQVRPLAKGVARSRLSRTRLRRCGGHRLFDVRRGDHGT